MYRLLICSIFTICGELFFDVYILFKFSSYMFNDMFELFIPNSVGEVLIKLYNVSYGINFDILCGLLSMSK